MKSNNAYVPLVWDEPSRQQCARPALISILQSARDIAGAEASCIVLLRDHDALEVVCPHRIGQQEFLKAFGKHVPPSDSLISIPFIQGLHQRGALCLFRLGAPQLSDLDLDLLEGLAAQAELALALARQQSAITRLETAMKLSAHADEELFIENAPIGAAGVAA